MAKAKKKAPKSNVATADEVQTMPCIKVNASGTLDALNELTGVISGLVKMQDKLSTAFEALDALDKEDAGEEMGAANEMLENFSETVAEYYKELNKVNRRVGRIIA